jgi:hypothetical protein
LTSVPLCAAAIWLLARVGIGNRAATLVDCLRMSSVFSSLPAVLTAGGIGRLAAQASMERPGGRRRAVVVAGRAMAAAGAALTIIATIPLGDLPTHPWEWLALWAGGAIAGAIIGVLIGLACGGPMPSLTELGMLRIEPIEWTRDLLGLDDRADPVQRPTNAESKATEAKAPTEPDPRAQPKP